MRVPRIRRADAARLEANIAAQHLEQLVGEPKAKRLTNPINRQTIAQAEAMRVSQDWKDAQPKHLVALFVWLHENVYGVKPLEILHGEEGRRLALGAVSACRALVKDEFGGHVRDVVVFMLWVWRREKSKQEWAARTPGVQLGRINARTQFAGRVLLTEFRLDRERKSNAPR